eukprot:CAMPEP_0202958558 /NCGR_PEP_ID=MMETSP1396-20130829/2881_1 /ASSEMBLY_ACC=CAM_ASM_000872 /TAXON_ID= /ORGANISM="Pseudokeronopsis sp., Strain Brazil" /LENGTH=73 /DNA_ID=CAMNT_0049676703 /DNA_START=433 /DNA_END=650 /DNA_ORIENTATION=-
MKEEQKKPEVQILKNDYDEDDIKEEIIEENQQNLFANREDLEGIGASASLGIDQSIDTLRMDEYDYVEEIKLT